MNKQVEGLITYVKCITRLEGKELTRREALEDLIHTYKNIGSQEGSTLKALIDTYNAEF